MLNSGLNREAKRLNRINLIILLDKLEDLIEDAPEIPLTGRVLLDADEILELVERIRNAVPEEVIRAEKVSTEKERMIYDAKNTAEKIISKAKKQAAELLQDSEIYKQAQVEAKKILEEAHQNAQELKLHSSEYANNVLNELEESLKKTLVVVSNGKEVLNKEKLTKSS